jgi:predicted TIM-barrel fold metal-dependent hydrolase
MFQQRLSSEETSKMRQDFGNLEVDCAAVGSVSRRDFLAAAAALGAASFLPAGSALAQKTSEEQSSGPQLIDLEHHLMPPVFRNATREQFAAQAQGFLPPGVLTWTPASSIEAMERTGVGTAIVSISTPGIWFGDVQAARSLARACNEYAAEMVRDYPGRFGSFASVALPDTEGSLKEIEYAFDQLKADGICVLSSYGDKWLGDPSFNPVFEELDRRKAIVYCHPTAPSCCRNLIPWVPQPVLEFPFDTTRTVASLLYSGTLTRFKNIRFIFAHAGGAVPMLAGRIEALGAGVRKELAEKVPNGVEYELKRLYWEIASSAYRPAIAALKSFAPLSQIMFGSDFPFVPIEATAFGLRKMGLSSDELRAISRENALALLPRFRT